MKFWKSENKTDYLFSVFSCFSFDIFLEFGRHVGWQVIWIIVRFRRPTKYTVEFENDAWPSTFVTEKLFLGALSTQQFYVKVTNFTFSRPFVEAAAGKVFTAASYSVVSYWIEIFAVSYVESKIIKKKKKKERRKTTLYSRYRNFSNSEVQCFQFPAVPCLKWISVLSTLASEGMGLNPSPIHQPYWELTKLVVYFDPLATSHVCLIM